MVSEVQVREPSVSQIRAELQNVLGSRGFRQSPGLSKLLRYICGSALLDQAERITEYTIAVDVFGKPEDFKEAKDSIVRVEVHRLRKRLAQFYEDEGAAHAVHIVIPTGKYVPQFVLREIREQAQEPPAHPKTPHAKTATRTIVIGIACAALILATVFFAYRVRQPSEKALDAFWAPVLESSNQILLCVGTLAGGRGSSFHDAFSGLTLRDFHGTDTEMVHLDDAATLARFAALLESKGKSYRVASQSEATFADLQNTPVILIGLLNNDWTKRLVGKLRFTVERPAPGKVFIRDSSDPAQKDWFIDYSTPLLDVTKDYALVLRVFDPRTEQMVVTAGGISVFGTLAAGEFLTSANEIQKLAAAAPKQWKRQNLELVLSTEVIRGRSGHPKIEAIHFW